MKPLKIAVVAACPFPYPRGTPVRALRLSEALAELGHRVHVATYHVGLGNADPRLAVHRIRAPQWVNPVQPGPSLPKLALLDPLLYRALRRMLTTHGPFDVVHAHHYEGLLLALAAAGSASRAPIVYDAHTLLEGELPTYGGVLPAALLKRAGRFLDRALPRRADHVATVTDALRDRLMEHHAIPAQQVTTIGNGLEPEAFLPAGERTQPGATRGETIVYAGNLAPYNRLDLLLNAFALLVREHPRARLHIYTDSPTASLVAEAKRVGMQDHMVVRAVVFADLPTALGEADVAVNPRPRCDGVPQKNLNYMAAGLPLVAFEGSLHPYVDGDTGRAVQGSGAAALARAIGRVLTDRDEARRMGAAARRLAEARYSWRSSAERLEGVYQKLLDRPARRA